MDDKVRSDRAGRLNPTDFVPAWVPRGEAPPKVEPARMGTAKVGAFVDHLKPPAPDVTRSEREVKRLSREMSVLGQTVRDALQVLTAAMVKRSEDKPQVINFAPTISPTPVTVRNEVAAPEVRPPDIHFHAPETPAPVIRVEALAPAQAPAQVTVINQVAPTPVNVSVEPTPLTVINEVSVPAQAPPIINLPSQPVTVRVEAVEEFTTTEVTERDVTGRLLRTETHKRREFDADVQPEGPEE